ncbi:hypothetical protein H2199_002219 [Coniosporium tulheliwenetii]|uniref:Uncharacterized protein n=1 Tax=Coniosporium tulheliwenetii TaxID=3383036 RepID=A0ACC2ZIA5_9PEZI|nr:hypothetical protein H2199_002219 [Cladosporium sp. JES 115]
MPLPYGLQMGYIYVDHHLQHLITKLTKPPPQHPHLPLPTANGTEVTVTIIHVFLRCFEMLPLAYTGATPAETALAAMVDCYFMARLCGLEEFRLAMLEGITEDLSRCSSIAVIEYVYDYVPEDWQLRRAVVMAVMERTEEGDLREWEYVYGG